MVLSPVNKPITIPVWFLALLALVAPGATALAIYYHQELADVSTKAAVLEKDNEIQWEVLRALNALHLEK